MTRRRVFDIEFPEGDSPPLQPAEPDVRRGPMASAIAESAGALAERMDKEAEIRVENDRLAHEFVRLKRAGLIVDLVPVDAIGMDKLTRDRKVARDSEIDELKESIRAVGLSNPIQVEAVGDGYELVQGFRRLTAYRELHEETGDGTYATIPAGIIATGETLERLYRKMVDENLVRRNISFAEMAMLARRYADDPNTREDTIHAAIETLFGSAGRQKKNYIGHFSSLLDRIGDLLEHPEEISRALGLQLEKALSAEPRRVSSLRTRLQVLPRTGPAAEVAALREFLTTASTAQAKVPAAKAAAKTTLRFSSPGGMVRCIASDGRIELRAERDFSSLDRHALEAALEEFFKALDQA
jgi:ParB family chromosome partitioning protein